MNVQPWKIRVITDAKIKEKLSPACHRQAQITTCSHLLVFCADLDFEAKFKALEKAYARNGFADARARIERLKLLLSQKSPAERTEWARRQVYFAVDHCLLGAKALGFDSCPMEGMDFDGVSKILQLPKNLVLTTLVPIGYAADDVQPKVRLEKSEILW
jgi:nitroreductase